GQLNLLREHLKGKPVVIIDHHPPQGKSWEGLIHINPLLDGYNGSKDISGAGVAYLVAKALDKKNVNLASLAVVGAVADLQNYFGRLEGINREILADAVRAGKLEKGIDLLLYGRYTRPIFQALQYFTDPRIPGVSGSEHGSLGLLQRLGINLKNSSGWRSLSDLEEREKRALASAIVALILPSVPKELASHVPQLVVGEVYSLVEEPIRSPLKDVAEYATCLNACGRHERADVGIKVTSGYRDKALNELLQLLRHHRQVIAKGIRLVEEGGENGIQKTPSKLIQYFNAENNIKPSIVGTVAGMLLGSEVVDPYLPVVGLSWDGDGVKVSARCSRLLVLKGVNMAKAITIAAKDVSGIGGGHPPACGAYLPNPESITTFLLRFEDLMVPQLSKVNIRK
ncbi:MAG: recombinase RecJ, partial [Methanobacteriota archaeon]